MRKRIGKLTALTIGLSMALSSAHAEDVEVTGPTLGWRNGDRLAGKIIPSEEKILVWKSDIFINPFHLDQFQLSGIEFPREYLGTQDSAQGPFRVTFRNGDRLFAEFLSIEAGTVTIRCNRLAGDIVVQRTELKRIERIDGDNLRYSGPTEIEEWRPLGRNVSDRDWYVRRSGEFACHRWGGELFREIDLPRKVELSFSVACPDEQPNFEIGVTEAMESGPRIETWDDTLVLTSGNRFAPIQVLAGQSREQSYRLFWDRDAQTVQVCDADGKPLASLDRVDYEGGPVIRRNQSRSADVREPNRVGFRILNRNSSLIFSRLAVRKWDGKTIPRYDASLPRIVMSGGEVLFNLDELQFKPETGLQVGGRSLPFAELVQLVFSTGDIAPESAEHSRLSWFDGSVISGVVSQITPEKVRVHPAWHDGEIEAHLGSVKRLSFPDSGEPVVAPADRLKSGDVTIGGRLTLGGNGAPHTLLSWQPVGSKNSSSVMEDRKVQVTRGSYPGATDMVGNARIYLTNNEVVVGDLISINADSVEFSSYITGQVTIPGADIRAVDIEGSGLTSKGFSDKGWVTLPPEEELGDEGPGDPFGAVEEEPEPVVIENEKVTMHRGGFGHLNLLVGDRIRFHTKWKSNYGVFTLRLFCSDFSKDSPSTDLLIGAQGSRILVGKLKPGGGFTFSRKQVNINDKEADIEVLARHNEVIVRVNGKETLVQKVSPDRISGNGIIFQTGGGWRGWDKTPNTVEFSDFSIDRSSGFLPKRIINQNAKRHALTVPRFHRKEPPTHVLVASNGDLLRGRLVSARGDTINFLSRGEEIELSRSRVSAIIWLHPPGEEAPAGEGGTVEGDSLPFQSTHQFVLHDGTRLNLVGEVVDKEDTVFVGESNKLGKCRVPLHSISDQTYGVDHILAQKIHADQLAYSDWKIEFTPEPAIPKGDGSGDSPMIGKDAPDFSIEQLDGRQFNLTHLKGRVVVLDFWATWCGPCIRAMPEVIQAVHLFRGRPVSFCAINQAETPPIINEFLELRGWEGIPVGLDYQLNMSRDYEVKGIPHTIVIGKDGKIAWVHTGYSPDLKKKLVGAISRALQQTPAP